MASATDPRAERRFSKGQVNRAGRLLLAAREAVRRTGPEPGSMRFDAAKLEEAWDALTWWRSLHAAPLSNVAASLRYHVDKEHGRVNNRIEVTQRLKRQATMIDKLSRERGEVTQMHDIGGVRAVLPSLHHVMAVSRRLRRSWTIVKVRDYVTEPKKSGYRALHLIVRRRNVVVEVQLRTVAQDTWANQIERAGRELGVGLKFGGGDAVLLDMFRAMADVLARYDWGEISAEQVQEALSDLRSSSEGESREG